MAISKVVFGGDTLVDLTGDTVTAEKLLSGITAHDKSGAEITGTIPSKTAETFTPGTADQVIQALQYLAGAQTIKGDANLVPENIVSGKSIFGVSGNHECPTAGGGLSASGSLVSASGGQTLALVHRLGVQPNFIAFSGTMGGAKFAGIYYVKETISVNGLQAAAFGVTGFNDSSFSLSIDSNNSSVNFGVLYQGSAMSMFSVDISWIVGVV